MDKCRICGKDFYPDPLLELLNMPAAAQNFPVWETLDQDRGIAMNVRQCSGCGVVQIDSEPVPYYREVIRASAYSPEMKSFRLKQFADWVKKYDLQNKKVLEAGCGKGEYLDLMSQSGPRCFGTEYSSESVQICKEKGLNVQKVFFEKGCEDLSEAPFDAFFILNWLEHIPDLSIFLKILSNQLIPEAPGLIEVPNYDMIKQNGLLTEFTAEHLYYFTESTLEGTLAAHGFDVQEYRSVWDHYILSAEVRKRRQDDPNRFSDQKKKINSQVRGFLSRYPKTVVWGAGHQSLMVLAMLGLTENEIRYVIDSAPVKQGKFTFVSHLPIVDPSYLESDPPDAVMIMCAGYSDEVVRMIRKKQGNRFALAIMRENGLEEQC
ncbi:MAG: class I SAM-dependent methyltransferase [Planctomycetia bacterium]|nr:class I SAM-dependent methyltransferase [Planctomycetia bacterium]